MKSILFILFFLPLALFSQSIDVGPVVGGVTDTSARFYLHTTALTNFTLEIDSSSSFSSPISLNDSTRSDLFGAVIAEVSGLEAATEYYYRILINGTPDPRSGSFKTFPAPGTPGHYKIVVGSCNYQNNFGLFNSIRNFDPDLFLHLGDWGWPPNPLGNDYNLYPDKIAESFRIRFSDPNMRDYVQPFCPVDFIYDDDYCYNDNDGWTYSTDYTQPDTNGTVRTFFVTDSIPAGVREGAIRGYFDHFPGYPALDTNEGIHHQIQFGNIDIFMLDVRSSRQAKFAAFELDTTTNNWTWAPDSSHLMLGPNQRDWLHSGLQNSQADWKFIGSSVIMNRMYGLLIQFGMQVQRTPMTVGGRTGSGATLAASLAYNWAGYPAELDSLHALIDREEIKDVFVFSGDSHSSMMDDGTYGGLPELQASGLAAGDEAFLNYYIDSVAQSIGFPPIDRLIWNGGGSGINNRNFSDTYGTVEVWEADSLRMCVVDELDQTLACLTFRHSSNPLGREAELSVPKQLFRIVFPNPAKDRLWVSMENGLELGEKDELRLLNLAGTEFFRVSGVALRSGLIEIPLSGLSSGFYLLEFKGVAGEEVRRIVVE